MENEITIAFKMPGIDEQIEKMEKLIELLREFKTLIAELDFDCEVTEIR